jgi:hypothetical protein
MAEITTTPPVILRTSYRSTLITPASLNSPGDKRPTSIDSSIEAAEKWAGLVLGGVVEKEEREKTYVRVVVIEERVLREIRLG